MSGEAMLAGRRGKLALIHLAKKQCGLDEEAYRALLWGAAGVEKASEIANESQYRAVMASFEACGFSPRRSNRKKLPLREEQKGNDVTGRQLYYIKGLWELASRKKDEKSLRAIVKRIGHVDDLRFLTKERASAVILALRDICWKAGYNPDGPFGRS